MSWKVTIRPQARTDVSKACVWYEEHGVGLGDEFLAALTEALLRLEAGPERFPPYYRNFRRVLTHRFPHKIFFQIVDSDIIIFRIQHGAQDHQRKLA